jgi:hypothetical protein
MIYLRVMTMFIYRASRMPTVAIRGNTKCDQDETLLKSKNIFLPMIVWLSCWKHETGDGEMNAVPGIDAFTPRSAAK